MGEIQVPCVNQECDNEDLELIQSKPLLGTSFKHDFNCGVCGSTFSLLTTLDSVKIPKEIRN